MVVKPPRFSIGMDVEGTAALSGGAPIELVAFARAPNTRARAATATLIDAAVYVAVGMS